jgi:cytochrome c553
MQKSVFFASTVLLSVLTGCNGSGDAASGPAGATKAPASAQTTSRQVAPSSATPKPAEKAETSPTALYQKCGACHGSQAEKPALGRSAVIAGWDEERIVSTIVGYQNGTYGGAMKTLMQNQVKDLSRSQIEALASYISHLGVKPH